jgi:hypothetical protein
MIFLISFIFNAFNDFHLMIESLHTFVKSEILAAGFEKSYFEAIWFINSLLVFHPRFQLVSIPSKY